ncbi:MAG TPA: hypothetical protein VMZ22_10475 [Acidimicrobiales bacterium]|nr:hypothetical protein [Acidimicrobiales bacterium]
MSTTHEADVVEAYVNEVRNRLADVPEEDRAELLDDVAAHVREIADEFGVDSLRDRLGTPAEFTSELRASAGYGAAINSNQPLRSRQFMAWLDRHVRTEASRALWRKLEPGWFVVRGVLFGYFVLMLTGADPALVPSLGNNQLFGLFILLAGAVVSFRLGERRPSAQPKWLRRARVLGEIALVVFAAGYLGDAARTRTVYFDSGPAGVSHVDGCLRDASGQPIANLYAFDPTGQLIPKFFLTDQAGRPIQNLCPEQTTRNGMPVETEYARDVHGAPVFGVFPRAQTTARVEDQTGQVVKEPLVPPAVVFPQLAPVTTQAPPAEQPAP